MLSVAVDAHLYPDTALDVRVYALEDRATVRLTGGLGSGVDVTLFADRAELVRLRDTLAAMVTELDTERAALALRLRANESAA
ncbi:hypothetical protein CFP66_03665 [Pseudonocardia sp. MH-G8]|nr:hypothetical protein CFP66_03665 [Pseudonocardia sp. MH-G8]